MVPLPRIFFPFSVGVIAGLRAGEVDQLYPYVPVIAGIASILFVLGLRRRCGLRLTWLSGCCLAILLMCLGYHLVRQHDQYGRADHFRHHDLPGGYLLVQIREPVSERPNTFQAVTDVLFAGNDSVIKAAEGRLLLYFEKDSLAGRLRYGDRLVVPDNYSGVSPPQNPAVFNYKRYLARQNIFHTSYLRSGEWYATGENAGRFYMRMALMLRERALQTLENNHVSGREFAVISALLLGYREYLDEDLRREFAGAGAMHILCVSGLHVGIIYMVLGKIFSFMTRLPGGRILKALAIILCIWIYAAVTGFSPSVQRASVMFTFVSMGQSFQRQTNIYNTLAASAIVLVAANPAIIMHIGFQLSYLAVISIVTLQPWFEKLMNVRNRLLSKAWAILTVSLAAQLATGPLALHYFHQFPNYFLLTNLVVIPLATVVIYTAILSLVLSPVPFAGCFAGKILSLIVSALHHSVRFIEGLPYSTTTGVYISFSETLLVFVCLFFLFCYLLKARRNYFLFSMVTMVLIVGSFTLRNATRSAQLFFVVYHVSRSTAIDFVSADKTVYIACDEIMNNQRQKSFSVEANRIRSGIRHEIEQPLVLSADTTVRSSHLIRSGDFIWYNGISVLLLHDESDVSKHFSGMSSEKASTDLYAESYPVDYLLITGNAVPEVSNLLRAVKPCKVILDASNVPWLANRIEADFLEAGVDVWNTRKKGAYVRVLR